MPITLFKTSNMRAIVAIRLDGYFFSCELNAYIEILTLSASITEETWLLSFEF